MAHRLCRLLLGPVDPRRLRPRNKEGGRRDRRDYGHPARHRRHDAVPLQSHRQLRWAARDFLRQGRSDHRQPGFRSRHYQEIQVGRRRRHCRIHQSSGAGQQDRGFRRHQPLCAGAGRRAQHALAQVSRDLALQGPAPAETGQGGEAGSVIRTEALTIRFGGLTALSGVNFEVRRGEVRAIIGPNGAGKSTFFNCLTGVLRPTSGRILFKGEEITGLPPNRISQKGIARSYQITNLLPNATTLENVRIAAQSRRHSWSMLRHHGAYADLIEKAEAVLEAVGLRAKADELAANLSHGEQRNLEIGIALATEPELLCLDEPTAGMSTSETHETMELVRRIAKNLTILIVEHDMQVVMELAQRITVLHYGEVLAEGTPAEIQQNTRVLEVYLKT